jgi:hypothetical protein
VFLFVQTWPIVLSGNGVRSETSVESRNNQAEFDRQTDRQIDGQTDRLVGSFRVGTERKQTC